jgi:uncharacterized membrane protein YkoI
MKGFIATLGMGGAALVLTVALAQGMMNQNSNGMMGGMNQTDMNAQMQEMTEQCNSMMQRMQGMMGQGMNGGMMDRSGSTRYGQQDAEALARAFLAGHAPDAEITQIERNNTYVVHFQSNGTEGVLEVDAETGDVQLIQND